MSLSNPENIINERESSRPIRLPENLRISSTEVELSRIPGRRRPRGGFWRRACPGWRVDSQSVSYLIWNVAKVVKIKINLWTLRSRDMDLPISENHRRRKLTWRPILFTILFAAPGHRQCARQSAKILSTSLSYFHQSDRQEIQKFLRPKLKCRESWRT